jgi:hypothetical protein
VNVEIAGDIVPLARRLDVVDSRQGAHLTDENFFDAAPS